jgi:hypothetical protein
MSGNGHVLTQILGARPDQVTQWRAALPVLGQLKLTLTYTFRSLIRTAAIQVTV